MGRDLRRGVVVPSLNAWRQARLLTQDEMAQRARVTRRTVIRAEQGLPIKIMTVARLARALHISREALMKSPLPEGGTKDE